MIISAFEFIRRFLLHMLPEGFLKIRYYGILSSRNLKTTLRRCKELSGIAENHNQMKPQDIDWKDLFLAVKSILFTTKMDQSRNIRKRLNIHRYHESRMGGYVQPHFIPN